MNTQQGAETGDAKDPGKRYRSDVATRSTIVSFLATTTTGHQQLGSTETGNMRADDWLLSGSIRSLVSYHRSRPNIIIEVELQLHRPGTTGRECGRCDRLRWRGTRLSIRDMPLGRRLNSQASLRDEQEHRFMLARPADFVLADELLPPLTNLAPARQGAAGPPHRLRRHHRRSEDLVDHLAVSSRAADERGCGRLTAVCRAWSCPSCRSPVLFRVFRSWIGLPGRMQHGFDSISDGLATAKRSSFGG